MEKFHFTHYLNSNFHDHQEFFDIIWPELALRLYNCGNNFKSSKEKINKSKLKNALIDFIYLCKILISQDRVKKNYPKILANAKFALNKELKNLGYDTYRPAWNPTLRRGKTLAPFYVYQKTMQLKKKLIYGNFNEIYSKEFFEEIEKYKQILKKSYLDNNVQALFLSSEIEPLQKLTIKIFEEIQKPSFVFLHGLPGTYNKYFNSRADYFIVWGEQIKQNYVNFGFNKNRIFVSGHPFYKKAPKDELRHNLTDILVLTNPMSLAQMVGNIQLGNRGNLIYYLYIIQNVLTKLGVKSVRFRPHHSESGAWYQKFIDNKFFRLDNQSISDSLKRSSLVIGPTSTVFLESLYYGVNYITFEPIFEKKIGLQNNLIVPPFDGSDNRIPVAKDEEQLLQFLKEKVLVDKSAFTDYIKIPFDLSFVKRLI